VKEKSGKTALKNADQITLNDFSFSLFEAPLLLSENFEFSMTIATVSSFNPNSFAITNGFYRKNITIYDENR
jgi:hypothetical protein